MLLSAIWLNYLLNYSIIALGIFLIVRIVKIKIPTLRKILSILGVVVALSILGHLFRKLVRDQVKNTAEITKPIGEPETGRDDNITRGTVDMDTTRLQNENHDYECGYCHKKFSGPYYNGYVLGGETEIEKADKVRGFVSTFCSKDCYAKWWTYNH